MARLKKADERAVQDWLAGSHEGSDRYRPSRHGARYGLQFDLRVRVGEGQDMVWRRLVRWYKSNEARSDAIVRTRQGLGLYGQQLRAGLLRKLSLVSR
jgi:hypothetical protein